MKGGIGMEVYHISQLLQLGDTLTRITRSYISWLSRFSRGWSGLDCFTAMVLQGKYLYTR